MTTEQIFASEALDLNGSSTDIFTSDDEQRETQSDSSDSVHDQTLYQSMINVDDILPLTQVSKPTYHEQLLESRSLPILARLSQRYVKRTDYPKIEIPVPKKLTDEEIRMQNVLRQAMIVPVEIDRTLWNPGVKFERPKDEMPEEIRKISILSGFMKATKVQEIMSQAASQQILPATSNVLEDHEIETGVLTQIEREENERHTAKSINSLEEKTQKVVHSIAEAVIEDFDDIDSEILTKIEDEIVLDQSLESLTQKLSSSQRAVQLLASVECQGRSDLNVTSMDLEAFPSDNEDDESRNESLCTEQIDFDGLFVTQYPDPSQNLHRINTAEAENSWLNIPEYKNASSKPTDLITLKDENQPCCSKSLKVETASGALIQSLPVKSRNLKDKMKFLDDLLLEDSSFDENFGKMQSPVISCFGFASAKNLTVNGNKDNAVLYKTPESTSRVSKQSLPVKPRNLKDKMKLLDDLLLEDSSVDENFGKMQSPVISGFGFASAKNLTVNKTENVLIFDQVPDQDLSKPAFTSAKNMTTKMLIEDTPFEPNTKAFPAENLKNESNIPTEFSGFGLASGKNVKLKDATMKLVNKKFQQQDQMIVSDLSVSSSTINTPVAEKPFKIPSSIGSSFNSPAMSNKSSNFSTPKGYSRPQISFPKPSPGVFSEATKSKICNDLKQSPKTEHLLAENPFPTSTGGFMKASGSNVQIKAEQMEKFSKNFEVQDKRVRDELEDNNNNNTPVKPSFKKVRLDFGDSPAVSSPLMMSSFKMGIKQQSTPLVPRTTIAAKTSDSQEVSAIVQMCESLENFTEQFECEEPPIKRKKMAKIKLLNKFNDSIGSDGSFDGFIAAELDSIEMENRIPDKVKAARTKAFEQQMQSVEEKADIDCIQMAGTLHMIKSSANRKKMKNYVELAEPSCLDRHHINFTNVLNYKFFMRNYCSDEVTKTNTAGISLGDNARLIMDPSSRVGIEEIKWSFLSSPGVDPKLVSHKWIENAFKMIVLKFAWLENSFKKFDLFELLSPENLLLQLKYRYDREIDRNQRSAIKKIAEQDDIPGRRMVLKVLDVYRTPETGYELELSDGWYSLRTTIDASLADAIDRNKIKIGTKLITSYAELTGCIACDPLDIISSARLKIHANSTRKVNWDHKMGVCRNPTPILIPLDTVLATGGVIGKIRVAITHVYPVIFVDASGETKEFRSEKLQRRIQNKLDVLNFSIYESVAHQVQKEFAQEMSERVKGLKKSKVKLPDLCAEDICDLLDSETDHEELNMIQCQMSAVMQRQVQKVKDERSQMLHEQIQKKMGERNGKVSQLLKFRVVDARNPMKTALVSCWSPTEDLLSVIKKGKVLEIVSSTAGQHSREIQVTAGKSTAIKLVKSEVVQEIIEKYHRNETKIADINHDFKPPNDEFDVVCFVVQVNPELNGRQKVYVADEFSNVMCLNFWSSLSSLAYDDAVIEGKLMIAKNLQWRSSQSANIVPQGFVSGDTTVFIINPKQESEKRRLGEFKEVIGDGSAFLIACNEKIAQIKNGNETINNSNQSINKSTVNRSASSPSIVKTVSITPCSPKILRSSTSSTPKIIPQTDNRLKRRLGTYSNLSFNFPQELRSKALSKNLSLNRNTPQRRGFK